MNKFITILASSALACSIASSNVLANIYVGLEGGLSLPAQSSFVDKDTKTKVKLGHSPMFGARFGYEFAPNMAAEFSYTYQPKYDFNVSIYHDFAKGKTKVTGNVMMLNLVYNFSEMGGGFKPYAIFGAGIAKIDLKAIDIKLATEGLDKVSEGIASALRAKYPLHMPATKAEISSVIKDIPALRIKKLNANYFAWQAGLGVTKPLNDNLNLDFSAKLQVTHNIEVKSDHIDAQETVKRHTPGVITLVYSSSKIKKTMGVAEIAVGLTYKLPY